MSYQYGEEIEYEIERISPEDFDKIQGFSCGNEALDDFFHKELLVNGHVNTEDGLPYKVVDKKNGNIISVFSLASSGVMVDVGKYTHVFPAIKIDVLAVSVPYQKLHMDELSKMEDNPDEHYYFSDAIMCEIIKKCRFISEEIMTVDYIILYADKNAYRYYQRNRFNDFNKYMLSESNCEISANIPMFIKLD